MVFSPLRGGRGVNFEKLKSLGEEPFFHHMGEKSIWGGGIDNGNQWGHNSGQKLSYYKIVFQVTFKEKNSSHFYIISFKRTYVNRSLANFKRKASSHKKLYNE